jgi:hypothetical protein
VQGYSTGAGASRMSTNLIDKMSEQEAKETLNHLAHMLEISASSRAKDAFIIAVNSLLVEAGYKIKVISFDNFKEITCDFRGHTFELEKEIDGLDCGYSSWYMMVKDKSGTSVCDGWIDDSSSFTATQAFEHAATNAEIEIPSNWKEQIMEQAA